MSAPGGLSASALDLFEELHGGSQARLDEPAPNADQAGDGEHQVLRLEAPVAGLAAEDPPDGIAGQEEHEAPASVAAVQGQQQRAGRAQDGAERLDPLEVRHGGAHLRRSMPIRP